MSPRLKEVTEAARHYLCIAENSSVLQKTPALGPQVSSPWPWPDGAGVRGVELVIDYEVVNMPADFHHRFHHHPTALSTHSGLRAFSVAFAALPA
jgi:hypothetical protein